MWTEGSEEGSEEAEGRSECVFRERGRKRRESRKEREEEEKLGVCCNHQRLKKVSIVLCIPLKNPSSDQTKLSLSSPTTSTQTGFVGEGLDPVSEQLLSNLTSDETYSTTHFKSAFHSSLLSLSLPHPNTELAHRE